MRPPLTPAAIPAPCSARNTPTTPLLPLPRPAAGVFTRIHARVRTPSLLPRQRARFARHYSSPYDAGLLTHSRPLADYFEAVAGPAPRPSRHQPHMGICWAPLNAAGREIAACPIPPAELAGLIALTERGELSGKMAKEVFGEMFQGGRPAAAIVAEKGLRQVSDQGALEGVLEAIFAKNPAEVAEFRAGKDKLMGFFVGQAMKATKGQANPQLVNQLVKKLLPG